MVRLPQPSSISYFAAGCFGSRDQRDWRYCLPSRRSLYGYGTLERPPNSATSPKRGPLGSAGVPRQDKERPHGTACVSSRTADIRGDPCADGEQTRASACRPSTITIG